MARVAPCIPELAGTEFGIRTADVVRNARMNERMVERGVEAGSIRIASPADLDST